MLWWIWFGSLCTPVEAPLPVATVGEPASWEVEESDADTDGDTMAEITPGPSCT